MDHNTQVTIDHETIRRWVAERGGLPAMVRRVAQPDEGDLVIDFPNDGSDEPTVPISWADFFQRFEDKRLAFAYRDEAEDAAHPYDLVDRGKVGL